MLFGLFFIESSIVSANENASKNEKARPVVERKAGLLYPKLCR